MFLNVQAMPSAVIAFSTIIQCNLMEDILLSLFTALRNSGLLSLIMILYSVYLFINTILTTTIHF